MLYISWLDFITVGLVDLEYLTWTPLPGVSIPDRCPLWSCSTIHPACQYDIRTQGFESGPPEVHHSQGRCQSTEGAGKHLHLHLPRGTQDLLSHSQQGSFSSVMLVQHSDISRHTWNCCVCACVCVLQTNQRVTVHVNNEQNRNCCSSRGLNVFAVEVPARTKMVKMSIIKNIMTLTNVPFMSKTKT